MKSVLPNRPGRIAALLGFFLVVAVTGFSAEKRVWVQYQSGAKGPVMAALAGAGGRVHYEFDNLGAIAVSLPEQALAGLSRNPNVAFVEPDPIRMLSGQTTPYGIDMVEASTVQSAGVDGSGIVVGVIDSGVFASHEDFAGLSLAGEPSGNPTTTEAAWNRDRDSHGTHVVGTIAAQNNALGVIGVAPGVSEIYMVKVFGDTGNWIYSSTLVQACNNAANNGGAKIISMSLGGGTPSSTEQAGMDALYNSGVLLIAAAGNAGNTTISYPAGYSSVMSVAAVDSTKTVADFSQKNATVEIAAPGVGVLSTVSYRNAALTVDSTSYMAGALEKTKQATASGILVDGGRATSTNSSWSGKVVLVERGDISFRDKVTNVEKSGGKAAIIYNNEPGGFSGTLGGGKPLKIPAISITQEDGIALIAMTGQTANVSTVANIDVSGYDYFDGTSMATPHVSGVAALVWSANSGATAAQVRQALSSTAEDLGATGRDNSYGYGLVNAQAAVDAITGVEPPPPPPPPPPGEDLVISEETANSTHPKNGSFNVTWLTNVPATSDVTINGSIYPDPDPGLVTSHVRAFRGSRGATYTITVTSTDANGNTTTSAAFDFTVPN